MPLMNNILFSCNYINFHKKSPSLVNRPILKRIILSTIWHTKNTPRILGTISISFHIAYKIISIYISPYLFMGLLYHIYIFFKIYKYIQKQKAQLIAELWFYLNSPVISFENTSLIYF